VIDALQRIAVRIRLLRYVAVALGLACLAALGFILFAAPASGDASRFLAPAIVGFIWSLSAWGFIDTFQSVPAKTSPGDGLAARIKRTLARAWFWFLAALFAVATLAALFLTFKLGSVWLAE